MIPFHTSSPRRRIRLALATIILILMGVLVWQWQNQRQEPTINPVLADYRERLPQLQERARRSPREAAARREYAVALYATGQLEESKKEYLETVKLQPNDAELFNNLGNVHRDLGEYQAAQDAYRRSIDLQPKQTNAYLNLAHLYAYSLQQPAQGASVLREALDQDAQNVALRLQLAGLYEMMQDKPAARGAYEEVLKLDPQSTAASAALERL